MYKTFKDLALPEQEIGGQFEGLWFVRTRIKHGDEYCFLNANYPHVVMGGTLFDGTNEQFYFSSEDAAIDNSILYYNHFGEVYPHAADTGSVPVAVTSEVMDF